ncbi:MAG: Methyltransferase type 11 [Solirubrobacterales bacterium]|jgi:ubiquinone/menaquinone biosynthesis C-methylase UbiE|nr:Methyltransferase type 11 [Solirubrobacterales bacterium]
MAIMDRVFAALYDTIFAAAEKAGLTDLRRGLLSQATGRVLELGAGTGANAALYPAGLDRLVLTEPEELMAKRLRAKVADLGRTDLEVVAAGAQALPFPDDSFDTVVSTLVLCTVPDVPGALAEVRRVLAPGGRLLFLEHVRNADPKRARSQDRFNPIQQRIAGGCHCNRPTPDLLEAAGFTVQGLRNEPFRRAYPVVQPLAIGTAIPV